MLVPIYSSLYVPQINLPAEAEGPEKEEEEERSFVNRSSVYPELFSGQTDSMIVDERERPCMIRRTSQSTVDKYTLT